ncbi:hypothetical protein QZH41_014854, partial [Actinostola sp. cb2023]
MKKEKEELELQKKFRCQPIPATTFLPFTTESTRLRENRIRKSLEEQRTKDKEDEHEQRRKQRRLKQLRPQVSRRAMANDNTWQLRTTADVKIKSF